MVKKTSKSTLTSLEKAVIKALLNKGERGQDIHTLINTGRLASVNFGRIAGVKASNKIVPASDQQVDAFRRKKLLFDHRTGLCPIDDERLVRAREAMILAVELFNTPRIAFKTGVFAMLTNVAWTYLLHEFYSRQGVQIVKGGYSLLLSQMIDRDDCPLSKPCKQNLRAMKDIRDVVEHLTIGPFDLKWLPLFQANCLNFEKIITELFGKQLTLGHELGFTLQFARMTKDEIAQMQGFDLPPHIAALDANLASKLGSGDAEDLEYQFKVIYTLTSSTKAKANFQFVLPDSAEGMEIQNVLLKYKPLDDLYPLKPKEVVQLVAKKSGRNFTSDKHQRAWKMFQVRPRIPAPDPTLTNKKYCIYHAPYNSYTYSNEWVDFLITQISDDAEWEKLSNFVG